MFISSVYSYAVFDFKTVFLRQTLADLKLLSPGMQLVMGHGNCALSGNELRAAYILLAFYYNIIVILNLAFMSLK